jgi:hypothetical protein
MPVPIPQKPRSKAIAASDADCLAWGVLSIGCAAALIAALSYFGGGDQTGAAFSLFGGAGLMGLLLLGPGKRPGKS